MKYPDGVLNYFVFDAMSNMVRTQDARGWSYFTYDALDRLTNEKAPDDSETSLAWDGIGRRIQVTSPAGSTYYAYDAVDRMEHAQAENAAVGTAYYAYDENGNVTRKILGNGCYTYFAYDAIGRTTKIENRLPGGTLLAYFAYTYDAAGRLTKSLREAGNVVYYGYDDADRLASETWKDSGGSTLHGFEWEYDLVGNRTYQKRGTDRTYFSYDDGNQLTQFHEVPADTWTYFDYDSRGNCVEINAPAGTTTLTYNDADLVAEIEYADATMNYFHYDALQRRYAMEDSAGLAYFTWDKDRLCLLAERDADGNVTASYTRGHAPVAGIGDLAAAELTVGGATYYQFPLCDHRGNVVVVTDENAVPVAYFDYDAWGTKLRDDAPVEGTRFGQSAPAWLELPDSDGSLALSPTRLYHKPSGRFLQRDPKSFADGINLYQSFRSNPLNVVDATGTEDLYVRGGNRAYWVIEEEGFWRDRDVAEIYIGKVRNGLIYLTDKFGGGLISVKAARAIAHGHLYLDAFYRKGQISLIKKALSRGLSRMNARGESMLSAAARGAHESIADQAQVVADTTTKVAEATAQVVVEAAEVVAETVELAIEEPAAFAGGFRKGAAGAVEDAVSATVAAGEYVAETAQLAIEEPGAFIEGFGEGYHGGASVTANILTLGGTDYLGITDSEQYQGADYAATRVLATAGRELLITAATLGSAQLARAGSQAALYAYQGLQVVNVARSGYDVGAGVRQVAEGDTAGGLLRAAGGVAGLLGSATLAGEYRDLNSIAGIGPTRATRPVEAALNVWNKGAQGDEAFRALTFKEKILYEIGQKALPTSQHTPLSALSAVERGRKLVQEQGILKAVFGVHPRKALGLLRETGVTPAVRLGLPPSLLTLRASQVSASAWDEEGNGQ